MHDFPLVPEWPPFVLAVFTPRISRLAVLSIIDTTCLSTSSHVPTGLILQQALAAYQPIRLSTYLPRSFGFQVIRVYKVHGAGQMPNEQPLGAGSSDVGHGGTLG